MPGNIDEIKKAAEEKKAIGEVDVAKPQVKIFEMQINALLKLADEKNEIFSQISNEESINISIASLFGANPCHNINERLETLAIKPISLPVLDEYIKEVFRHRHKLDRKRVVEYLRGLESLKTGEGNIRVSDERRPPLLSRFV